MENETETLDSSNEEKEEFNLDEIEDLTALKEKYKKLDKDFKETSNKNSQLFERAKKAEGFEKNEEGEWVKVQKPKPEAKEAKSDDKLLERLEKISLKTEGIKEADEIELFNKWKDQTGREADDIVGNEIFKKELEDLRTTKKNLEATSDIKGEGEQGSVKDNPDYWIGKAIKGDDGKLRFPEETPKELYTKILDKLSAGEPGSSEKLRFYNE